jgi:hypothetical protein
LDSKISENIATKIMGWNLIAERYYTKDDKITSYGTWKTEEGSCLEWNPVVNVEQAFRVLDKIKDYVGIDVTYDKDGWYCCLHVQIDEHQNTTEIDASAPTIAKAISLSLNRICEKGGFKH